MLEKCLKIFLINFCTLKTVAEFNMLPMIGFNIEIPSSFAGKWKIRIDMVFKDLPGMEKEEECIDVKFDIMEF